MSEYATLDQQLKPLNVPMPADLLYYAGAFGYVAEWQLQEMVGLGLLSPFWNRSGLDNAPVKVGALRSYFAGTNTPAGEDAPPAPVDYSTIPIWYADDYLGEITAQVRAHPGTTASAWWLPPWYAVYVNDRAAFDRAYETAVGRPYGSGDDVIPGEEEETDTPAPPPPPGAPAAPGAPPAPGSPASLLKGLFITFLLGKLLE
jgi:hypothetical protein